MECEQYPDNPDVMTCVKFTPDLLGQCALMNIRKSVPVILEQYIDDPNPDLLFDYGLITSELINNMMINSIKGDPETCFRLKILKVGAFTLETFNHINPDNSAKSRPGADDDCDLYKKGIDEVNGLIKANCCSGNHDGNYGWGNKIVGDIVDGANHEIIKDRDENGETFHTKVTIPIKLSSRHNSDVKLKSVA